MHPTTTTTPDFEELEKVIRGEKPPTRVHLVELGIDGEVVQDVTEHVLARKWIPDSEKTRTQHMEQYLSFYAAMGYDFAPAWGGFDNMPEFKERKAVDTAALSHGERHWVEEGGGIIKNWDDFERVGWDQITPNFRRRGHGQTEQAGGGRATHVCEGYHREVYAPSVCLGLGEYRGELYPCQELPRHAGRSTTMGGIEPGRNRLLLCSPPHNPASLFLKY